MTEQTGRMNRSVDSRSDLYACGVTLYEMLTGVLAFSATDPMEWIHCHIAANRRRPSMRATGIPDAIEATVEKLLENRLEDRFPKPRLASRRNLQFCQAQWEAHGRIEPFFWAGKTSGTVC